jgi:hypothetical protein
MFTRIWVYCRLQFTESTSFSWGTRWRSWLRHSATSRKVAGSTGTSHWLNPSRFNSASKINEYQERLLRGKDGQCVGVITLPPSCADCREILGTSTSWYPKSVKASNGTTLPFLLLFRINLLTAWERWSNIWLKCLFLLFLLSRIHENLTINYVLEIKSSEIIKLRKASGTQHKLLMYIYCNNDILVRSPCFCFRIFHTRLPTLDAPPWIL